MGGFSWSEEDLAFLKKNYTTSSIKDIAAAIGRTHKAVKNMAGKLNLIQDPTKAGPKLPWSNSEVKLIEEHYQRSRKRDLLNILEGRSWKAIREKANSLGIRRDEELVKADLIENTQSAILTKYGEISYFSTEDGKQKAKETNMSRRGVPYAMLDEGVKEKAKKTVQKRYGVDNVFQDPDTQKKAKDTLMSNYGVNHAMQSPEIRKRAQKTSMERYGFPNPLQVPGAAENGMLKKYGKANPLRVPELMEKKKKTCLERYGFEHAIESQEVRAKLSKSRGSPEAKKKDYETRIKNNTFTCSKEELVFGYYLSQVDTDTLAQQLHPDIHQVIDFYSPKFHQWVQYDGAYWHQKTNTEGGKQQASINKSAARDATQDEIIPNLVRFRSDEVDEAIKRGDILAFIEARLSSKQEATKDINACHQYRKRVETYTEDLATLPFNTLNIKPSEFTLQKEPISSSIKEFIVRYEWLGTLGPSPKWCFTARYKGVLAGVVLINEPNSYSNVLGTNTKKYEALIQRGASAAWTPKNLGSMLIMYACRWMVNNTEKRAFTGYADPAAGERGVIYRACNFEYLGNKFGNTYMYRHAQISKMFTSHDLKRTSAFKKWCRENSIETDKSWFKINGFKNINNIPDEIKRRWYADISRLIQNADKVKLASKSKFILVLGKDKREQKFLNKLKTYTAYEYTDTQPRGIVAIPKNSHNKANTFDRKNPSKLQYIIDNHKLMSTSELAKGMNESARWVKRQIALLIKEGRLDPKR